jgi:hypothetical protein
MRDQVGDEGRAAAPASNLDAELGVERDCAAQQRRRNGFALEPAGRS